MADAALLLELAPLGHLRELSLTDWGVQRAGNSIWAPVANDACVEALAQLGCSCRGLELLGISVGWSAEGNWHVDKAAQEVKRAWQQGVQGVRSAFALRGRASVAIKLAFLE